jgi:hypothetical protein
MKKSFQFLFFASFLLTTLSSFQVFAQIAGEPLKISKAEENHMLEQLKNKSLNGFFGISFTNSVPQAEFQDNVRRSGQGFSLYGGYYPDPIPVAFGAQCDFMFYGRKERIDAYDWFDHFNNRHTFYDTASIQNLVIPISIFARLQQNVYGYFLPYFEIFTGLTFLSTSFEDKSGNPEEDDKNSKTKTNVAFNYGIAAGCMIKLLDVVQLPSTNFSMLLDLRMRYAKGTKTTYSDGIIRDDGTFGIIQLNSQTDMIVTNVGLVFRF